MTIIEVTQEDIEHGTRSNIGRCPVALAASRALGKTITVGLSNMGEIDTDEQIRLSLEVRYWITRFDLGHNVWPFTFEVDTDHRKDRTNDQED